MFGNVEVIFIKVATELFATSGDIFVFEYFGIGFMSPQEHFSYTATIFLYTNGWFNIKERLLIGNAAMSLFDFMY